MTAVTRLFVFTLTLVMLGASSACITTFCLSALCGDSTVGAARAAPAARSFESFGVSRAERSDHNCNLMRF